MQITTKVTLNLQSPDYAVIYEPQGNNLSRFIHVQLMDGSAPWTVPTGTLMTVRYKKIDGTFGMYDTNENNASAYTISGSTVDVELVSQMLTVAGDVAAQLDFYNAAGQHLSTFSFRVAVEESPITDGEIESSDYFNVLTATLAEAQQIWLQVKSAYGAPRTANTAAAMTDHSLIYVYTGTTTSALTNGHWYFWNGSAWTDGGVYNSTAFTTDTTLTIAGAAADAKATGDAVGELKTAIKDDSITRYVESDNLLDADEITVGYQINGTVGNNYTLYASSNRVVSPLIPCKLNDSFYITRIDSNISFGAIGSSNFVSAIAIDKGGKILKRNDWVQGFIADVGNPVYVRFTIALSVYQNNKIINITKNHYPTSRKGVSEYFKYKAVENDNVDTRVIDMWGDSRIGNGWEDHTDISSFLRNLLNTNIAGTPAYGIQYKAPYYTVHNYGVLAQASGMVAARFGTNEIFVNLYGDSIPASGERQVSTIRCTTGNFENFDCWSTEASRGVPCEIEGVRGSLIRSQSTIKFVRKENGTIATEVRPNTKIIVPDYKSKNHVCIFMCGKNDMGLADGFQVNGVIGNVFGMYSSLGHDYFIVLGETYNCNEDTYGSGTVNRGYVDEINAWYAANIPNNFIDIQAELIANGLTLQGITPTAEDEANIAKGFIPNSLMQDEVHPNSQGREAMAKIIYTWIQNRGWI